MTLDMDHLGQWLGRTESVTERIAPFPSQALALTLNREDAPYQDGVALPPLWHWLHFLPLSPLAEAGEDGHPRRGGFLPPVPLPRRMWAGSRFTFHTPLLIGDTVSKVSTIARVEHKAGRSGELVFVTVRHAYSGTVGLSIEEEHDIVYRAAAEPGAAPPPAPPAPDDAQWSRPVQPDPVLLFRYSALTFNSHRIHYDQPYVTGTEGYPGLIVHGPLIATLLLDGLRRRKPEARVKRFSFRAVSPLFDVADFTVNGRLEGEHEGEGEGEGKARLWAANAAGELAMDAAASFGE